MTLCVVCIESSRKNCVNLNLLFTGHFDGLFPLRLPTFRSLFTNSHSEYAQAVLQKSCVCTQARECNCIAFTIPDHIEDSRDRGKARNKREDGEPTDMRKPQYALLLLSSQPPLSSEPTKYACATTILPITLFVFDTWDYMRAFKIEFRFIRVRVRIYSQHNRTSQETLQ